MGNFFSAKNAKSVLINQTHDRYESKAVHFSDLAQSLMTCANDGVVIFETTPLDGVDSSIVYVNQAFTNDTGYRTADLIGKSMKILEGPKTNLEALARIRAALRTWQPIREEILSYKKDGQEIWFAIELFLISNQEGLFTHWVSMQRNITARKKLESNLIVTDQSLRCDLFGHYYSARQRPLYLEYLTALGLSEAAHLAKQL
jgi:PAS domain S-box-containing protein